MIVVEIKNIGYLYFTQQLRAQVQLAINRGVPFELIVSARTRLARTLAEPLQLLRATSAQGDTPPVIFSQEDGLGTDPEGQEYTANPVTHRWEPVRPGTDPPPAGPEPTSGPPVGNDGGDGIEPAPEPEPGPVDPVDPLP